MTKEWADQTVEGHAGLRDTQLGDLTYHLIWATRRRRPFLQGAVFDRTRALLEEAARAIGARVTYVRSGGDHLVIGVDSPPELAPALIAERLKRYSAGHLRREFPELRKLPSVWTRRYLATTHEDFPLERIAAFVARQPRSERRPRSHRGFPGAVGPGDTRPGTHSWPDAGTQQREEAPD